MNEGLAFGFVAVICGVLTILLRVAGTAEQGPYDASTNRERSPPDERAPS
jgi:hypothetical protein